VQLVDRLLTEPLRWRFPALVFVNSMSDLFHEAVPDDFIARVFAVMALAPQHTFQVLTKRPERMAAWVNDAGRGVNLADAALTLALPQAVREDVHCRGITTSWPLPNVHLGVSIEDQPSADARIPHLLRTPAAVRFISYEPALGPVDLTEFMSRNVAESAVRHHLRTGHFCGGAGDAADCNDCDWSVSDGYRIDWLIAGGESGPHARPLDLNWARSLRDQCRAAGVPFLFKQVGGRTPKAGGRLLDGMEHHEFPQGRS
jgi:protein gp37